MGLDFTIRPWRESDAPALVKYAGDPRLIRNFRDRFPHPYTMEDAECYIRVSMAQEDIQLCRTIEINGEAAGDIGLFPKHDVHRKTAELGYWVARPYWGRGIATAAVREIVREGFRRLDIVRIYAEVFARNAASRRVVEKNGFTLEGILRNNVLKDGELMDECIYALLREEAEG